MSGHLSLLVLDFNDPAGESADFLEAIDCFNITRLLDHRAAWNHVLSETPADVTLLLLPSDQGQGLRITLPDLINHIRTCWKQTPLIAWSSRAASPVVKRIDEMGIHQFLHGEPKPALLLPALGGAIGQILDRHVQELNEQHTRIARAFRDLRQDCSKGTSQGSLSRFIRLLSEHFRFEEDFMRRHRYDGLEAHVAGHRHLLELSRDILSHCVQNGGEVTDDKRDGFHIEMERHIQDDGAYLEFIEQIRGRVTATDDASVATSGEAAVAQAG